MSKKKRTALFLKGSKKRKAFANQTGAVALHDRVEEERPEEYFCERERGGVRGIA